MREVGIILFFIGFLFPCDAQISEKEINGRYEMGDRYFIAYFFTNLKNGKFKSVGKLDLGKSKGKGAYQINWADSTITFEFKYSKSKAWGKPWTKKKDEEVTYKINDTVPFSFNGYIKCKKRNCR